MRFHPYLWIMLAASCAAPSPETGDGFHGGMCNLDCGSSAVCQAGTLTIEPGGYSEYRCDQEPPECPARQLSCDCVADGTYVSVPPSNWYEPDDAFRWLCRPGHA